MSNNDKDAPKDKRPASVQSLPILRTDSLEPEDPTDDNRPRQSQRPTFTTFASVVNHVLDRRNPRLVSESEKHARESRFDRLILHPPGKYSDESAPVDPTSDITPEAPSFLAYHPSITRLTRARVHPEITIPDDIEEKHIHTDYDPRKSGHAMRNLVRNTLRIRSKRLSHVPTRKSFVTILEDVDHPLGEDAIKAAPSQKHWIRLARKSLPSKRGLEVETTEEILEAGLLAGSDHIVTQREFKTLKKSIPELKIKEKLKVDRDDSQDSDEESVIIDKKSISKAIEAKGAITLNKKIKALRLLADNLSQKRIEKREIIALYTGGGGSWYKITEKSSFRKNLERFIMKINEHRRDFLQLTTIWERPINEIQGKFGFSAASYFRWLRTILYINIAYFIITLGFIIIPEMVPDDKIVSNFSGTCLLNSRMEKCPNSSRVFHIPKRKGFDFGNLFIGDGFWERSYMYYSGYKDTQAIPSCPPYVNEAFVTQKLSIWHLTAFRFTMVLIFIFIFNSYNVATRLVHFYSVARMETRIPGITEKDQFNILFCSWDFSCSDPMTANALKKNIWRELNRVIKTMSKGKHWFRRQTIVVAKRGELQKKLSEKYGENKSILLVHILINVGVVLMWIFGAGLIFFSFLARRIWFEEHSCTPSMEPIPAIVLALPAILISITTFALSKICIFLSNFESWGSTRNKNYTLGARVGFYYLTIIMVLYGFLATTANGNAQGSICHEEQFGHELYRIVVFQGIFSYLPQSIVSFIYHNYKKRKDGDDYEKPDFELSSEAFSLFFLHTVSGFGLFFCPLLSLLVILRLVVTFYHNKFALKKWYTYPTKLSHMSEIAAPYLATFTVSCFVSSILNLIVIVDMHPSEVCGPFSHFGHRKKDRYHFVFTEITSATASVMYFLLRPGVAVVCLIILISVCHFFRSWGQGYVKSMIQLHKMLLMERADKDFLLKMIYSLGKGKSDIKLTVEADNRQADSEETPVTHHATFNRRSLDVWMKEFLQSNRTDRRGGLEITPADRDIVVQKWKWAYSNI